MKKTLVTWQGVFPTFVVSVILVGRDVVLVTVGTFERFGEDVSVVVESEDHRTDALLHTLLTRLQVLGELGQELGRIFLVHVSYMVDLEKRIKVFLEM